MCPLEVTGRPKNWILLLLSIVWEVSHIDAETNRVPRFPLKQRHDSKRPMLASWIDNSVSLVRIGAGGCDTTFTI